jgi:CBS domain-containing protein
MSDPRVKDWTHRGDHLPSGTPAAEVAATMDSNDTARWWWLRAGAPRVISRTDLINARFQPYMKHWRGLNAEHLMSKPVVSVAPDTPINEAVQMLNEKRIHRLVVEKAIVTCGRSISR